MRLSLTRSVTGQCFKPYLLTPSRDFCGLPLMTVLKPYDGLSWVEVIQEKQRVLLTIPIEDLVSSFKKVILWIAQKRRRFQYNLELASQLKLLLCRAHSDSRFFLQFSSQINRRPTRWYWLFLAETIVNTLTKANLFSTSTSWIMKVLQQYLIRWIQHFEIDTLYCLRLEALIALDMKRW